MEPANIQGWRLARLLTLKKEVRLVRRNTGWIRFVLGLGLGITWGSLLGSLFCF